MTVTPIPLALTSADGTALAALHWEAPPAAPAVVVVPGFGSRKENHSDFAAALSARGMAALALDVRGHGASGGSLDGGAMDDVRAALDALAARGHRALGLRGSSMGGMLSLAVAADDPRVRAVVAICPAQPESFATRWEQEWARAIDLADLCARPGPARGFWHARGDQVVDWARTFHLAGVSPDPVRLHIAMGGGHETLQHDPAMIAATGAFLADHLV